MCIDTQRAGASPGGLNFGSIPKIYSAPPCVALERKGNQDKVLMVRNWTSVWDAIRSTPGASPPHLGGRTRRDSNETPTFIRDRLTLAREGSLGGTPVSTPPSRAERDASGRKKRHFFVVIRDSRGHRLGNPRFEQIGNMAGFFPC